MSRTYVEGDELGAGPVVANGRRCTGMAHAYWEAPWAWRGGTGMGGKLDMEGRPTKVELNIFEFEAAFLCFFFFHI
jgi:hypothetical protein